VVDVQHGLHQFGKAPAIVACDMTEVGNHPNFFLPPIVSIIGSLFLAYFKDFGGGLGE
jgi:hypothetical protein